MANVDTEWRQIPLFQGLTETQGKDIEQKLQPVNKPAGTVLFQAGDHGSTMYFILSGEVEFTYPHSLKEPGKFTKARAGEFFGEVACFSKEKRRTATAKVTQDLEARILSLNDLKAFVREHPDAAFSLMEGIVERVIRLSDVVARNPFLIEESSKAPPKTWMEKAAKAATEFAGSKGFFALHGVFITVWIVSNTLGGKFAFDSYPFNLLGLLITTEALLIASVVLMNQTREKTAIEKDDETLRSYAKTTNDKVENLYNMMKELQAKPPPALPERKSNAPANHAAHK